jgi:hypothetical protein
MRWEAGIVSIGGRERHRIALVVGALLLTTAAAPAAEPADPRASAILAAAAAATGGAAWDHVREVHIQAKRQSGDDTVDEEIWFDPHDGATVLAIEDGSLAGRAGFDGKTAWTADVDGTGRTLKEAERADLLAEFYWRSAGWSRPIRPPASATWVREEGQGTRARDVVRITAAEGAAPLDIVFDRTNHLPLRAVMHLSTGDTNVQFSQWRRSDGVTLPTRIETEPAHTKRPIVEIAGSTVGSATGKQDRYAVPQVPLVDYVFPGEASSAELPMKLFNLHPSIEAHIGKTRFRLLYETAATAAFDRAAAQKLGLAIHAGSGPSDPDTVRLPELGLGGVTLRHQTIPVRDLSGLAAVEGVPLAGIIGSELARRLVVEIDYEGRRLVLLRPDSFVAPPAATPVALVQVGRIPTVEGRIDGLKVTLALDTGSAAGLVLSEGFVRAHGLIDRWHPVPALVPLAPAPPVAGLVGRAASLELGVLGLAQPLAWVVPGPVAAGDGSLGNALLQHYDVIIDQRHGQLWLQANRLSDGSGIDLAGLALSEAADSITIGAVLPQGPAGRAGLKPGDVVETVGGDKATLLGLPEIRSRLAGPVGTAITIGAKRNGDFQSYRIVLADPLAVPGAP